MTGNYYWFLFLLLFFLKNPASAQQSLVSPPPPEPLEFAHLTREDGLPSDEITTIFQDSRGFMWFGTVDGLARYDGYEIKGYKRDPNDPRSLPNNSIISLYEDRGENLWIGTTGGLARFDRSTENFTRYMPSEEDSLSLQDGIIMAMYEDEAGLFWLGTQSGGLVLMDREKETFTSYLPDPDHRYGFISNKIEGITADPMEPHLLWVASGFNERVYVQFNTLSRTFIFHDQDAAEPGSVSYDRVTTVSSSRNQEIWFGTAQRGIARLLPEQDTFLTYQAQQNDSMSLSDNYITGLLEDRHHRIWVSTRLGGLNKLDPNSHTFHHYRHDPYNPKSISSDNTTAVFEDASGVLWVGTAKKGISYVNRNASKFTTVRPSLGDGKYNIVQYAVSALYQDQSQTLWIGTQYEGLQFLDQRSNTVQHFREESAALKPLSRLWVWSIVMDQAGDIWIGTNSEGLYRFDPKERRIKSYLHDPQNPNSLASNFVSSILPTPKGFLWLATSGGLQKLDIERERFQRIRLPEEGVTPHVVTYVYEDHHKNLWVATGAGLFWLTPAAEVIRHFTHEEGNPNSLSSNAVKALLEDHLGNMWVATSAGLNKISFLREGNAKSDQVSIRRYTDADGLANNGIAAIQEDAQGQLWVSTLNGLSLFKNPQHDPSSLPAFKNYQIADGLQGYVFNSNTSFKSPTGELFFGGEGGFNRFHPDSIRQNPFLPPVVITSFESYNTETSGQRAVSIQGISEKKALTISYQNNIFTIDFAALSFRESHKNQYAYQLTGFSDQWIQLGTKHQVTFTNLDPGTYTFRVKGSNHDGIWNEEPAELIITITPPWWATWWAYSLYVLATLLTIYAWVSYELGRRQLQHDLQIGQLETEKLKELDQLKSSFFANISHEFRTPLTLILGPLENFISRSTQKEDIREYHLMKRNAQRLLRLINQLLDISRLEAGKMKLETQYADIVPFIKGLFYAFESLAARKNIRLHFEAKPQLIMLDFDPNKMEQIITNVLSNTFKFTAEGGTVSVTIAPSPASETTQLAADSSLLIRIKDTGIGIAPDQLPFVFERFYQAENADYNDGQGSGIGLALARELVELHQGQIRVSSVLGAGTEFTIELPIKRLVAAPEVSKEMPLSSSSPYSDDVLEYVPISDDLPVFLDEQVQITDKQMVLLVEDNSDMRAFIRAQLEDTYEVRESADGQEGLAKAIETTPDLIISDVMMPRMDGLQLCDALKKDERTSHIPIILLTAKVDIASRLAALERGADAYLAKPFNRLELLLRVRKLLELRHLLQMRYASLATAEPSSDPGIQVEDAFLQKVRQIVMEHLSEVSFDMEQLSGILGMSRSQIFRKIKALSGQSPSLFIRTIRLQHAKQLLQTTDLNISEVAYRVGFSTPAYFSNAFMEAFGVRPSEIDR